MLEKTPEQATIEHAKMLIDGQWVDSTSGAVLSVDNPANRRPIAQIPRGGVEDVITVESFF